MVSNTVQKPIFVPVKITFQLTVLTYFLKNS